MKSHFCPASKLFTLYLIHFLSQSLNAQRQQDNTITHLTLAQGNPFDQDGCLNPILFTSKQASPNQITLKSCQKCRLWADGALLQGTDLKMPFLYFPMGSLLWKEGRGSYCWVLSVFSSTKQGKKFSQESCLCRFVERICGANRKTNQSETLILLEYPVVLCFVFI